MVVILTHKNIPILDQCLNSYNQFVTEDHKLIICENSDDDSSLIIAKKYDAEYLLCGPHYEAGGINEVFKKFPNEKEYFFFQDSVEFMCFEWEKMFRVPCKGYKCVGLSTFPIDHHYQDTIHAREWYSKITGKPYDWNTRPIMGNMFYCPNSIKDVLLQNHCDLFIPNCKLDSCGMERIWPALLPSELLTFTEEYTKNFWGWMYYVKKTWHNRV
jgi:glycosyltransferase involved in cell wall biosynthesis